MVSSSYPRRILVPEEGPGCPLFSAVEAGDTVEATILFGKPLAESQLDNAEAALLGWFAGAEWGGRVPILVDERLTASCLHVAVTGVRTAESALRLLLDVLVGTGVPVQRAVFARLREDGDRDALVRGMDPSARPQVEYDDPDAWWEACFDASAAPPLSEDRAELASDDNGLLEIGRTTYVERRGLPLHVRDVRICYGLAEVARGPLLEEAEQVRADEVARALRTAIQERFGGIDAPPSTSRVLTRDVPLDCIRSGGRLGYACAFKAGDLREFLHDHLFRYREYELMLALREAIRALDLEPVVCWRRFDRRYVVQLWERGASRVHQAA
jgi:hypothetical protein